MEKQKVIVHIISSMMRGGAETLLCQFVRELQQQGYVSKVIYFHPGPLVENLKANDIECYHVGGKWKLYDPWFFIRLFKLIKKLKPDCLHTWLWSANFVGRIIAKILTIPVICSLHNNLDQNGTVRIMLDKLTLAYADRVVAVSYGIKRSLAQVKVMVSPAQLVVIKNGIEPAREVVPPSFNAFPVNKDFIIGSVGRWVPLKNYPLLLEVFNELYQKYPHIRLLLVGSGPEEEYLRKLVKEYGLSQAVSFVVNQPAQKYYPLFDCFVLSSFKEGISIALLEAMSHGLVCLSTHHEQQHDVIEHDYNGFIAYPQKDAMKPLLERIIQEDQLRRRVGEAARKTIQQDFSLTRMTQEYINLYCQVMLDEHV